MIATILTFIALAFVLLYVGAATIGFWMTFFILAFGFAGVIAGIAIIACGVRRFINAVTTESNGMVKIR